MNTDRRAASQASDGRAGRRARLLRYALGLAAIGVVAYFFVRERDLFAGFGATISRLSWVWVVVAFAAELASVPPLAEAQRIVLRAGGVESDRLQMNLVTLASNAISTSVPVGVAVAEGYSFTRYRRFGADVAVAAWSELAIGAITFCALAALALVGAVIAGGGAESVLLPLLSVVVAGSAGAALLFRHPQFMLRTLDWSQAHLGRSAARWAGSPRASAGRPARLGTCAPRWACGRPPGGCRCPTGCWTLAAWRCVLRRFTPGSPGGWCCWRLRAPRW